MDSFEPTVTYYEVGDAIRVQLRDLPYWRGRSVDLLRAVDYAEGGRVIGVVIRDIQRGIELDGLPEARQIADVLYDKGYGRYLSRDRREGHSAEGADRREAADE